MIFTREVPPEKNRYSLRSMMLPNVFTMVLAALCVYPFQLGAQDIRDVPADLTVPGMGDGVPVAGKRVRQVHPDYKGTSVHHALYLPDDWIPGKSYPVIVEYTGNGGYRNEFGDACDGRVEGASLGYGISGGSGCIWMLPPFAPMPRSHMQRRPSHGYARNTGAIRIASFLRVFPVDPSPATTSVSMTMKSPSCGKLLSATRTTTARGQAGLILMSTSPPRSDA
jgi:hypothetical protein